MEPDIANNGRPPAISVVVATHNRAQLLERLLDALDVQEFAEPFEVIVVDDASTDHTQSFLTERAMSTTAFTLVPKHQSRNAGPAAARNVGWRAARAPIVCFTDDDCIPQKGWLAAHQASIVAGADLVHGRTMPVPDQKHRSTPFSRSIQRERDHGFYETCNMSYRREVLEAVGGFDEDFTFPFGEDTDLAWRAIDSGCGVVFNGLAEVFHEVWPFSWPSHLADIRRQQGLVLLVHKHSRLRELFPTPWCTYRRHSAALGAVGAGVAALAKPRSPLRWAVAAGSAANYYSVCRATRWPPRKRKYWPGYLAAMMASDLAEVAVMARASVKHRTFLL